MRRHGRRAAKLAGAALVAITVVSGMLTLSSCGKGLITSKVAQCCGLGYADIIRHEPGLIGYYRMGQISSSIGNDSPQSVLGVVSLSGTFTLGQPSAIRFDPDPSVLFDGSSGYGQITFGYNFGAAITSSLSIEAWVRMNAACVANMAFVHFGASTYPKIRLGCAVSGGDFLPEFSVTDAANTATATATSPSAFSQGTWTHLVGTKSGGIVAIFANGSQLQTGSTGGFTTSIDASGSPAYLAQNPTGPIYAPAALDEVAIYNVALSAQQIATHYRVGTQGPQP